jgi:beta-phosphoglucomutase-like phosphatase (HAD superfamily)
LLKGVVFDFDDCIINNKVLDFESFRLIANQLSIKIVPSVITKKRLKGELADDIITWMIKKSGRKRSIIQFKKIRSNFLMSKNSVKFYSVNKGIINLLKFLDSNDIICVITTIRSNKNLIEIFLKNSNLSQFFKKIYPASSTIISNKNNNIINMVKKKLYKKIICDLKVKTSQIVVIGNTITDIQPAMDLGMVTISIPNSYGIIVRAKSSYSLKSTSDIVSIFKKNIMCQIQKYFL